MFIRHTIKIKQYQKYREKYTKQTPFKRNWHNYINIRENKL